MALRSFTTYLRRTIFTSAAFCVVASPQVQAQQRSFASGEIVIYCQPNTSRTRIDELAKKVNATVAPLLLADAYKFILPPSQVLDQDTLNAVSALKTETDVKSVSPNYYRFPFQNPTAEPNDPRYKTGEQYALKLMKMPQAWALQKGSADVNIAVIDSGFNPNHEDIQGQFLAGSTDIANGDADYTAGGTDPEKAHGQFVAGVIFAKTNNAVGIAGIAWENIKCLALKAMKDANTFFTLADLSNAYTYVYDNRTKYKVRIVNLSLGGVGDPTDTTDLEYIGLKKLSDAGIVVVAAAGNSYPASNINGVPSGYPFVFSVGSVGPSGKRAYYSQVGKVDIAAPGGDQFTNETDGVLGLTFSGYGFEQGTSFASPAVAGVLGLMVSFPGVTGAQAVQAMKDTADRTNVTNATLPDPAYGYGVVNAYQAVLKVSTIVVINSPTGLDANGNNSDLTNTAPPIESLRPTIKFTTSGISPANVTVKIDGNTVDNAIVQAGRRPGLYAGQYVYEFSYTFPAREPFSHTIVIIGQPDDPTRPPLTDTRQILIKPKRLQGVPLVGRDGKSRNLSFISIPYYESAADSPLLNTYREFDKVFGAGVTLYRYAYVASTDGGTQGKYAINPTANVDDHPDLARFLASDIVTSTIDAAGNDAASVLSDARPLGLGFFADLPNAVDVFTYGKEAKLPVRIPLHEGWNMIGDPFPYPVAFNALTVQTGTGTYPISTAADQGVLLPVLYRYVNGNYEFSSLPGGDLRPWEGHWVYVNPRTGNLGGATAATLVVPPTQSGTANRSAKAIEKVVPVSGAGSWAIRLEAHTKNLSDANNVIGLTANGGVSLNRTRVPKPPKPAPFVSLGLTGVDDKGTQYAQLIQQTGGTKTWDVTVNSDQTDADVTVTWPSVQPVPRNYRLTLTDKVTGQAIDMRQSASYTFNTGRNAALRGLTITAAPVTSASRVSFSNVYVNPNGGRGQDAFEIGYTVSQETRVEISILANNGRTLALLGGTRAAATGDNHVVWSGRDSAGKPVPAGVYVLQLKAVNSEGAATRETRSFLVTR